MSSKSRPTLALGIVTTLTLAAASPTANAQPWFSIDLGLVGPNGFAPNSGYYTSTANGGAPGQQVGGSFSGAGIWNATANSWQSTSFASLHPAGAVSSSAFAISGNQQVGAAAFDRLGLNSNAGLWTGSASSWVNLHPTGATSSAARATSGSQQGGWAVVNGIYRPSLWTGTASSWTDLTPAGQNYGEVFAVAGGRQGGYVNQYASLWSGTADSWVNLHPAGFTTSEVRGMSDNQQVGFAQVGFQRRAGIWSGTSSSFVDIHPSGFADSIATATNGINQVGLVSLTGSTNFAAFWTGSAGSFVNLHNFLPSGATFGGFTDSWATGIYTDGINTYVTGWAAGFSLENFTRDTHAVLWWTPNAIPAPSAAALLTLTGLLATRRRRA